VPLERDVSAGGRTACSTDSSCDEASGQPGTATRSEAAVPVAAAVPCVRECGYDGLALGYPAGGGLKLTTGRLRLMALSGEEL
jgi:hypothetical protein